MRARCTNPKDMRWPNYGGRGIKVCDRWLHSFENFLADMGEKPQSRPRSVSIERSNNDGDYEPSNCRWAGAKEQGNNTRSNRFVEHDGITLTLTEWAKRLGISPSGLHSRYLKGEMPPHLFRAADTTRWSNARKSANRDPSPDLQADPQQPLSR